VPNRQRIKEQLTVLKQSLEEQRTKINSLEQQMRADSKNAAMMKSVINMLKGQLEEKSNRIMELQAELDNKNLSIQELNTRVENLTSQNAQQQETISAQQDMISTQDDMLNMGYVKIGTKQELKDKGLLSTGFLKKAKVDVSNVSKNLFKSVNIREYTEVTINSKKIKIMTQMPEESYTTEEKGGKTVLHINDPAKFWSISKFLIIMTD
jgi:chromosome segregation ATPase